MPDSGSILRTHDRSIAAIDQVHGCCSDIAGALWRADERTYTGPAVGRGARREPLLP